MQKRVMGNLGHEVSLLGFGAMRLPTLEGESRNIDFLEAVRMMRYAFDHGVNYVDTAYGYHGGNSELAVAQALADGYRQKVMLATKSPTWLIESTADFGKYLDEQLQKLQTDCIDFYLQHGLGRDRWDKYQKLGIFEEAMKAKAAGKIKHYGFSFHDTQDAFMEILNAYPWEFCQIQYNYLDTEYQAGKAGLQAAAAKGMPVIVMEPLRGGRLATGLPGEIQNLFQQADADRHPVEWAFRWLADQPEATVILSGMSTFSQVEQNISICQSPALVPGCFSTAEQEIVQQVATAWHGRTKVNCTDCKYCMPCPQGIDIPGLLSRYNNAAMFDLWEQAKRGYQRTINESKDAGQCVACGACEAACPQKIAIIETLKEIDKVMR
ncbi:MAG: aldo/keto reductase [Symbiobacteriaceae bacterium]|nr:aldo/keto reductase [Symbiobacteriaceae bacterium]